MINSLVLWFSFWLIAIVLFSYFLSICLIGIDQNTKLNSTIIGIVMLPIVTSLPEMVTVFLAPSLTDAKYATFNMLGSNTLTQTALVLAFIVFFNKKIHLKFSKININTTKLLTGLSALLVLPFFLPKSYISIFGSSLQLWIFLIAYLIYLSKSLKNEESTFYQRKTKLTKFQSIIGFIVFAILLIISAIQLLKVSDMMARPGVFSNFVLSQSLVGTLFLSLATTLPEILTYYWILKMNSPSIAINGILGSDLFNIAILAISDIFIIKGSALDFVYQGGWNTIIGRKFLFTLPAYAIMLLLVSKKWKQNQMLSILVSILTLILFIWSFKAF